MADETYRVYLQMTETFFTTANSRVFDASIEGVPVIDDLDLLASAPGKWVIVDRSFVITVSDGQLNLGFSASINNTLLSALVMISEN
ncbi:MAG: hypothetical protein ACI9TH_001884 [Kiritimatiellia bacterium]